MFRARIALAGFLALAPLALPCAGQESSRSGSAELRLRGRKLATKATLKDEPVALESIGDELTAGFFEPFGLSATQPAVDREEQRQQALALHAGERQTRFMETRERYVGGRRVIDQSAAAQASSPPSSAGYAAVLLLLTLWAVSFLRRRARRPVELPRI